MKHVLITGGSRGIGAAAVAAFAARGDHVTFLYHQNHAAAQAVARRTGATPLCCDVANGDAVARLAPQLQQTEILINNAGICHTGLISQITPQQWQRLFDVNVTGIYHCVNTVLPGMLARQAGCIINVSSMWGQVGASCEAAYSATKGAVLALTKALAQELGPSHIRVNAVAPGVILTDMCREIDPAVLESLQEETPIGRHGTPEDVAQAMCYLADAAFVTGQVLPVNGGFVIT